MTPLTWPLWPPGRVRLTCTTLIEATDFKLDSGTTRACKLCCFFAILETYMKLKIKKLKVISLLKPLRIRRTALILKSFARSMTSSILTLYSLALSGAWIASFWKYGKIILQGEHQEAQKKIYNNTFLLLVDLINVKFFNHWHRYDITYYY